MTVIENKVNKKENSNSDSKSVDDNAVVLDVREAAEATTEQTREVNDNTSEKKKKPNFFKQFFLKRVYITALVCYILSLVLSFLCDLIYQGLSKIFHIVNELEVQDSSNQELVVETIKNNPMYMIVVIVIGPFIEELIFRLCIFRPIQLLGHKVKKYSGFFGWVIIILAYLISSYLFGFAHYGLAFSLLLSEIETFPSYFIAGIMLACAYHYDGYFAAPIVTHMLSNLVACLFLFLF